MNIVFFNFRDCKHPAAGGAEVMTEEIAARLVEYGHTVSWFCASFPGAQSEETVRGINIIRQGNAVSVYYWAYRHYLRRWKGRCDVIIDQIHGVPFFTPLYAQEKVIAFIHEVARQIWLEMFAFPLGRIGYTIEPLFFKLYKHIPFITVSKSTKQDLEHIGIRETNIHVVPQGLSCVANTTLPTKNAEPTIIFMGRMCSMKRMMDVIQAAAIIQRDIPNIQLWLAGSGDKQYIAQAKQLIAHFRLESCVTWYGYVTEQHKKELLQRAWLIVGTSIKEGWGLVISEAAACGTPAVAYNVGGYQDSIIDDKTGILCDSTPPALACAVVQLLNDKKKYVVLQKQALEKSKQMNWDVTARAFEKILISTNTIA